MQKRRHKSDIDRMHIKMMIMVTMMKKSTFLTGLADLPGFTPRLDNKSHL